MQQIKVGAVTGTGSDINVELGFEPTYIKVMNRTIIAAGAGGLAGLEWFEGMADDEALAINAIADNGTSSGYNVSDKTSDGLTIISTASVQTTDPVQGTGVYGFQIPAAFQSASDELYYIACR